MVTLFQNKKWVKMRGFSKGPRKPRRGPSRSQSSFVSFNYSIIFYPSFFIKGRKNVVPRKSRPKYILFFL